MQEYGTLSDLSDRDRRWLVHIFAALQQGIQDELECDSIPFHDQNVRDAPDRFESLWTYVHNALTQCMERTHAEEALLVSGLQELEGTNIAPDLEQPGVGEICQAQEFLFTREGPVPRRCPAPATGYGEDGTPYCAWHLE